MLTALDIVVVKSQFRALAPMVDDFAAAFYRRLFQLSPDLRSRFPADLFAQRRKLVAALAFVVDGIERVEDMTPRLAALGRAHIDYGATPAAYDAVGAALLDTLEEHFGEAFGDLGRDAWSQTFAIIVDAMEEGAAAARREPIAA